MDGKAHDATRALVHRDQHPVCVQDGRFASKHIETPQTVLRMTEDREPFSRCQRSMKTQER